MGYIIGLIFLIFLNFWVSPNTSSISQPSPTPVPIKTVVNTTPSLPVISNNEVFSLVNQYRVQNGLPKLEISSELCSLADSRAKFMMQNNMAAAKTTKIGNHTGLRDIKYSGNGVGENLDFNATSAQQAVTAWENSPPHKVLLLSTQMQGVSISHGCVSSDVENYGSVVVLLVGDK